VVDRAKTAGAKRGYVYLHSIVDGFSRLAYTEPLEDEKGVTAAAFLARAKVWFADLGITHIHRVVTDSGSCYRSGDFARIVGTKTNSRRTWVLPVLVIEPWTREDPEEYSLGTRPMKEPMVLPVNRCQSPISTASANPVRVLTPRRQPSLCTGSVNSESAAISPIAVSSRSRRALTVRTFS
jgi:hypothetical protein